MAHIPAILVRPGSSHERLMRVYVYFEEGLTDVDAATLADLLGYGGYWKRCGQLRSRGLIAPTGERRRTSGKQATGAVCAVTPVGWAWWWQHGCSVQEFREMLDIAS